MIVTARKTAYDDQKHRVLLEKIDPAVGVACLAGTVQRDLIMLFEVHADGLLLGIFLARIDRLIDGGRDLVICHAAAVDKPSIAMTRILNAIFDQVARDYGLNSVRIHSDKKGLDRIMEKNNYVFQEAVYRKVIDV